MTDWRPSSGPDAASRRAALLARIRSSFARAGILPVDTPALGATTVTDPHIDSLAVGPGWLQTSPEYYMKRLLAAGYPDIYSIGRVFRAGERGARHLPEFTMVEWYRLGFDLDAIIADTARLLSDALGGRFAAMPRVVDYVDAFREYAGVDPLLDPVDTLVAAAGADEHLRTSLGEDRDTWLDLLLSSVVSPRFPAGELTVLRHYPASQAALARLCPADARVADRFEVFAGDLELANGYVELTDADLQARRMARDIGRRQHLGKAPLDADIRLLAALESGLPPCAGVALGFERLHMLADDCDDIKNVVTFPGDLP